MLTSSWSLIKGAPQRVGRPGPLFLFHCIRFHIGPGPTWTSSSSTSALSYFQTAAGVTRSANPHGRVPQPRCQQQPRSLFPALPGPCGASRQRPDLLLPLFPWAPWRAANPTSTCSRQEEDGVQLQGRERWFSTPVSEASSTQRAFVPQRDGHLSIVH